MSLSASVPLLTSDIAGSTAPPNSSRLHKAAQDFESLLIGEMLKSARADGSDGWLGSGEDSGEDSAMDMAQSQLANALASGGGIGLAKTIERAMDKGSGQNTSDTQPANSAVSSLNKP